MPASDVGKPDDDGHDASLCPTCIYGYRPAYRPHTLTADCWCTRRNRDVDANRGAKGRIYQCDVTKRFGMTSADIESGHRNSPG